MRVNPTRPRWEEGWRRMTRPRDEDKGLTTVVDS
jgi:hypothetical protein